MIQRLWALVALVAITCWAALVVTVLGLPALGFALGVPSAPALPRGWQPPAPAQAIAGEGQVTTGGNLQQVGELHFLTLRGDAWQRGAAHGMLLHDAIVALEGDLVATLHERVPTFLARHLLLGMVAFNNRRLHTYFSAEELIEIRAAAAATSSLPDPWRAMGPAYQRAVHYHALHDVSQYLIDNPLVRPIQVGCSAFAHRDSAGGFIVGRLFDFEGGPRFDLDKVVMRVEPDQGYRYLHVAWAGVSGAVTGMNEAGLWVSINAAATSGQSFVGRPIIMAVREILQHCATLDEAAAVLARSPVFVSNGVLVASRQDAAAAVFEIGPRGLARRDGGAEPVISSNHFSAPQWADDPRNQQRVIQGTTAVRAARLAELLAEQPLDSERAVAILRDRKGLGGREVGFQNRSTINAWIGAHLVVADIERGVLWVSEPRHGLGAMRAFSIDDGPLPALDLAADPELPRLQRDLQRWLELRSSLVAGISDPAQAQAAVAELLERNPHSFESHWLAGIYAPSADLRSQHLQRALELQPAYAADRAAIQRALAGADSRPGDPPPDP